MKPKWTYDIELPKELKTNELPIRKFLQTKAQPTLSSLATFDLHAENNLLFLYKNNKKWRRHMNHIVADYAIALLNKSTDFDTDLLKITAKLIHEPTTKLN